MIVGELSLAAKRTITVGGDCIGAVEIRRCEGRDDWLMLSVENGPELLLPSAVDVSERLQEPRLFVVEGERPDVVMLVGGEIAYWIDVDRNVVRELKLFRKYEHAEYWETSMIDRGSVLVVVYESGILAIDSKLDAKWHIRKLFNDVLVAVTDESVILIGDEETPWSVSLVDGTGRAPD
ncbi:MAG: hypothetical protein HYR85_13335 [Planctomycetes bacterium]|nr:hypothetical protein [Planctomycetota bacterium]MBI3845902.1 hypothetical protein [Planctomycetota bacterium]